MDALDALGFQEIEFSLNGGGDDGECHLSLVRMNDGSIRERLPDFPIAFAVSGQAISLEDFLSDHTAEVPEEDWVNNDGGSGTVVYYPDRKGGDPRIDCLMSYGEGEDDEDFCDVLFDDRFYDEDDGPEDKGHHDGTESEQQDDALIVDTNIVGREAA
ncbi:hypothetical protein [Sphingomonas sp. 3-13AW]|uniref:hypothetical protein n=1 Tax=Sphingomonas sp. 3-13AW TaxID=3050450 RepID=UPI003BB49C54